MPSILCGPNIPVRSPGDPGHIGDHNKLHCLYDNSIFFTDNGGGSYVVDAGADSITINSNNLDINTSLAITISAGSFEHLTGTVGFFGASPVAQPNSVSAADALEALGLATNVTESSGLPTLTDDGAVLTILPAFAGNSTSFGYTASTPDVTGGTWTWTFDGVQSGAIPWNADGPTAQGIIDAMSNINPGDMVITPFGSDINNIYVFAFTDGGQYGLQTIDPVRASASSSLTGPSQPYTINEFVFNPGSPPLPVRADWTFDIGDQDQANDFSISADQFEVNADSSIQLGSNNGNLLFYSDNGSLTVDTTVGQRYLNVNGDAIEFENSDGGWITMNVEGTGHITFSTDFVSIIDIQGSKLGFFGTSPVAKPTGVAVSAAAIHAALVSLGLISA